MTSSSLHHTINLSGRSPVDDIVRPSVRFSSLVPLLCKISPTCIDKHLPLLVLNLCQQFWGAKQPLKITLSVLRPSSRYQSWLTERRLPPLQGALVRPSTWPKVKRSRCRFLAFVVHMTLCNCFQAHTPPPPLPAAPTPSPYPPHPSHKRES